MTDELARRKALTFEQAEGLVQLPSQMERGHISKEMRARLWKVVHDSIIANSWKPNHTNYPRLRDNWKTVLSDWHLDELHRFADEFSDRVDKWVPMLKILFEDATYAQILGFMQYVLRHGSGPRGFAEATDEALIKSRAAYRVYDGDTIAPIGSEAEAATIAQAFNDLDEASAQGSRVHLQNAAAALTAGQWANSVRESVHAVESVVRLLGKSSSVDEALKKLSNKEHINRNMSAGLGKLYHYSSDEQGIRHPLLEAGDAKVDEADALYMFGACAAFITYLLRKGRAAALI